MVTVGRLASIVLCLFSLIGIIREAFVMRGDTPRPGGASRQAASSEVVVTSFGYLHGDPPAGQHLVIDLRHHFRDPHRDPALRDLTAEDPRVYQAVLGTAGISELVVDAARMALAFRDGPVPGTIAVAFGCAGGRHRAAAAAIATARLLGDEGVPVTLTHRDMHRPVVDRPRQGAA
jgi:RNase adaptor protein for sRNA GlmZ degradation